LETGEGGNLGKTNTQVNLYVRKQDVTNHLLKQLNQQKGSFMVNQY